MGAEKLTDEALSERLEEWICGEGASAQIDAPGDSFTRLMRPE